MTAETAPETLLETDALQVTLGGQTLLHDIGLKLGRGEAVAIVGEAGSGKSILAQSLAALDDRPAERPSDS